MEEKNKRKIEVVIAGITMSLVTDESDSFVNTVVKRMDESMSALLNRSVKRSQLDAAMLCAIDFCGDKISAEKKVRNLEAQISLYDVNMRRLRDENHALRKRLEEYDDAPSLPEKTANPINKVAEGEQISIGAEENDKANQAAESSKQPSSMEKSGASREDKIKMIEDILKK